jgi:hypothetical protein
VFLVVKSRRKAFRAVRASDPSSHGVVWSQSNGEAHALREAGHVLGQVRGPQARPWSLQGMVSAASVSRSVSKKKSILLT